MQKIKVLVINGTGSEKKPAKLCMVSGIIEYELENTVAHISGLNGKTVEKVIEVAPVVIPDPTPEPLVKVTPAPITRSHKKKSAK